ncbi:MAG: hypothetical protein JSU85_06560 [Candidatus Zixiibacteriota bacterium]|nr:MAG: hypothetical protein JSU85_06560 [candidate division Zixibacteria bacterium]
MIKALSSQLKELAKSDEENFRTAIKNRLDGKATEEQISAVKEFIFLLPPTLKILNSYWDDPKTPLDVKKLSGILIAYIIRRDDLLSDEHMGLFGYLDDSYIVVSAFLKIQEMYLRDWQDKSPEERELTERARKLIVAPRIVIPDEATGIDEVMELYVRGHITSFEDDLTSRKKASH